MSAGALACPQCGQADGLATIEELTGTARAMFYADDIEWADVFTDVDWGGSMTVGIRCDCGWFVRDTDWREVLVEVQS